MSSFSNLLIHKRNEILEDDKKIRRLIEYDYLKAIRRTQREEYELQELEQEFGWLSDLEVAELLKMVG